MTQFFKKSQTVNVSRISTEGWWLENTREYVTKGTALGSDFTQNMYTPSSKDMIARYSRETNTWSDEIENMTFKPYWNQNGQHYIIGEPDGDYPDWAIKEEPPKHNQEKQTVFYTTELGWKVYDILIGKSFYDDVGNTFIVSDFNFELPKQHTWVAPPKPKSKRHVVRFVEGEWLQKENYLGEIAYKKSDQIPVEIDKLGPIPEHLTLLQPNYPYEEWNDDSWQINTQEKYIHDYNQTDDTRRGLYSQICDPLVAEANIKHLQGNETEAKLLEAQALAAWQKIHDDNPWPKNPTS